GFCELLEFRRTKSVNFYVRIFFSDVPKKIDIPLKRQFWMMPALHQNLNSARRRKLVEFLVNLLERKHIMILVAFRPIKGAEFAVNVADIRVVDIAIDDVSHDLASAPAIAFRLCQIEIGRA